jgi:hypothetical protein
MRVCDRRQSAEERLDHQDHPGPTAKWSIVDLAMGPLAKPTEVDQLDLQVAG